eukprot:TRINITY_DN2296_c0_g1_i4.p1 TRINITY_DN2296_c0_g1~~TRINITY_DN2296_c0_g1_i4.p1  ORF type:complete len:628 (-),score=239.85 TRINITY_DN2296_c0_g1_i4:46-1854(-)
MSATLINVYAPTPGTTRGRPTILGSDPKGKNFLYCTGNAVVIRDIANPLIADLYYEHTAATTVAKYAPSGFYIASGDVAGNLRIWDTTQKEHPLKIELKVLAGPILDLAWSPDNQRLVVVGDGKERFGAAFLWDTGASVGEIGGHSKAIISCDFRQIRPFRAITGSEDFQVNWFEGPPFKFHHAVKDHKRFVNAVRFSPDGLKVITVGQDKKGYILDGKTGEKILELSAEGEHGGGIYGVAWSPDSKQVLTASGDKTAKLWDANTGANLQTFPFGAGVESQQLGVLWQGPHMITVNLNGDLTYLDPANPAQPHRVLRGHNRFITALAFDKRAGTFYTGSYDASIVQWDVNTGSTQPMEGQGHTNSVTSIKIQGDHLITCSMDDTVRITPLDSRKYGDSIPLDGQPAGIAVGTKQQDLIVAVTHKALVVIRNGKVVSSKAADFQPSAVALSTDETEVAVGGKDNKIRLYSLDGGVLTEKKVLEGHRGALTNVQYSPDGQWLASADQNRDIFVWSTATHQIKIQGWVFHSARVNSLAWAPNSLYLASGALDLSVYVWSIEKPDKRVVVKLAHQGGVNDVVWMDDNTLASVGQDATIKTWNIKYH